MTAQPQLPELPPMKAAAPTIPEPVAPAPVFNPNRGFQGTRRLRQIVSALMGGGVTLILAVLFLQLVARPGLRPTDVMATMEAQTDLGIMNQKLGHRPGEHVLTEAEYQETIAKAQREGQTKAELSFQRELAVVQADKERVVGAYQTLYQRANMIAQAALQLETMAQQMRAQLLQMTNGGRSVVIMFKDLICGLGDASACASAREDRGTMIAEADELSRGDVGARVRELMTGIEDPAAFVVREDRRRNGTPVLPN